ncbi:MAG: MjaI family restriction endonuclease [Candidatus Buchananbacteria bacterium]
MLKIKNQELINELVGETNDFPKYTTQLLNLVNSNAGGTRPRVVGQLTELIKECPEKSYEGWKKWYLAQHPTAIDDAVKKISEMLIKMKEAVNLIDEKLIKRWVEDLVLEKTFVGLRFQEAILKKIASIKNTTYRLAEPHEESKGIDGFIGDEPVSIKPETYKLESRLPENIPFKMIYYKKVKDGLEIETD